MVVVDREQRESPEHLADKQVLTAPEAGQLLGIGHTKLAQILKTWDKTRTEGLPFEHSRLDRRVLLIKRTDVTALLEQSQGITVEEARRQLGVSRAKMKELIESGELPVRDNPLHKRQRFVDPKRFEALLAERNVRPSLRQEVTKEKPS